MEVGEDFSLRSSEYIGTTPGFNYPLCFILTFIYSAAFLLYTNVLNLVNLPTKMQPLACSLIYECMIKKLSDKLPPMKYPLEKGISLLRQYPLEKGISLLRQSQTKAVNPNLTPFLALDQHGGIVPLFLAYLNECSSQNHLTGRSLVQIEVCDQGVRF